MYVELKNINKTYGDYKASSDVNFGIEKGKLIGLLGPSGSGKTTILRMIAGLENPDSGEIIIDGEVVNNIPASKRGIGFVFQNYALFRYMTVFDNIAFGLKIQKKSKKYIRERVKELIKLIGLEGLDNRYPSQLSGGQRQVVTLLMCTLSIPKLLLLDEHTAALDPATAEKVMDITKTIVQENNITTMMITHNLKQSLTTGTRTIMLDSGEIILDLSGEERKNTTMEDMIKMYSMKKQKEFDNDRILLSQ